MLGHKSGQCLYMDSVGSQVRTVFVYGQCWVIPSQDSVFVWIVLGHTKSGQCFCMDSVGSYQVRTVFLYG